MSALFLIIVQFAIIAYALIGGIFIAFSDFIMRSLARTSGTGGVEAMQTINREVFRWIFMALFLGLAPLSLGVVIYGVFMVGGSTGTVLAAAGLSYFVGCFGVTVAYNVPLNERLAKMNIGEETTTRFWRDTYLPQWTWWNSVRGGACILAAALLLTTLPALG
ncbi:MAG: anthrone oxygenase family protein [Pseudomonadota bacterium]